MDKQDQNQSESFIKGQVEKGKEKLKDEAKKRARQAITKVVMSVLSAIGPYLLVAIVAVIIVVVIITGIQKIIYGSDSEEVNSAKATTISTKVSGESSSDLSSSVTDTSQVQVSIVKDDDTDTYSYAFISSYDEDNINETKEEIDKIDANSSDFSEFELEIITALIDGGLDIKDYSTSELKCFAKFLKAEVCAQYLDLRPNDEKLDSDGNYVPETLESLDDDGYGAPGVILVQRTNTNENESETLEYIGLDEFNALVSDSSIDALDYFTIDEEGNLVIAKWSSTVIAVTGSYPDAVSEQERTTSQSLTYTITTEKIAYSDAMKKYSMPFDFLVQLLMLTNDTNFCLDIADTVLNSKIVINIQEEETITHTVETRDYKVHDTIAKYINYTIKTNINDIIEEKTGFGYLLNMATNDEGSSCTNYNSSQYNVEIETTNITHTYEYQVVEADIWYAHYLVTYSEPEEEVTTNSSNNESLGEYEKINNTEYSNDNSDSDVQTYINSQKMYYTNQLQYPTITVVETPPTGTALGYQTITILNGSFVNSSSNTVTIYETDADGDGTGDGYYSMPTVFGAYAKFNIQINGDPQCYLNYTYQSQNNTYTRVSEDYVKSDVTGLLIEEYEKMDTTVNINEDTTKYVADDSPTKNTEIYALDDDGNYQKFLATYDKYTSARSSIVSASTWLFDEMEENENTVDLVDVVKYLLFLYNGNYYGVSELELDDIEDVLNSVNTTVYGTSDYVVKTDEGDSDLVLTKEDLEEAIKNTYKGTVQSNLLSCLDEFIEIQDDYNVNAVFAVAVTIIESSGGTNWSAINSSTYNWYSIKGSYNGNSSNGWRAYSSFNEAVLDFGDLIANGSYYFKANKYTVAEIAPTYCNAKWGEDVSAEMTKIYKSIGVTIIGGEGGIGGTETGGYNLSTDGYLSTFTVGTRTYKNFKQAGSVPWASDLFEGRTISSWGCSITSVAIIASGFGNDEVTPYTLRNVSGSSQVDKVTSLLEKYTGMNATYVQGLDINAIIAQLQEGNPVMVLKNGYHWWVLLSISEDGSQIYVSDPGRSARSRWESVDSALTYFGGGKCDRWVKLSY